MDEFGMQLKIQGSPDWDSAKEFVTLVQEAGGDEDAIFALIELYCNGSAPENAEPELCQDNRYLHKDLSSAKAALDNVLSGSGEYGMCTTLPDGEIMIGLKPNTNTDHFVEMAYQKGVLAAAGFWL